VRRLDQQPAAGQRRAGAAPAGGHQCDRRFRRRLGRQRRSVGVTAAGKGDFSLLVVQGMRLSRKSRARPLMRR
jgi:hypothetical protein